MVKYEWPACDQQYGHPTNTTNHFVRAKLSSLFGTSGTGATFSWLQEHLIADVVCSFCGVDQTLSIDISPSQGEGKSDEDELDAELIRSFSRFLKVYRLRSVSPPPETAADLAQSLAITLEGREGSARVNKTPRSPNFVPAPGKRMPAVVHFKVQEKETACCFKV